MTGPCKRIQVCILCLFLLLLAGCGGMQNTPEEPKAALGRYVEEMLTVPDSMTKMLDFTRREDGTLSITGYFSLEEAYRMDVFVYISTDGGQTWQEDEDAWVRKLPDDISLWALTYDAEGIPWFVYEAPDPVYDALMESGTLEELESYIPQPHRFACFRDGKMEEQNLSLYRMNGLSSPEAFYVLKNGDVLASYYSEIVLFDKNTGEARYTLHTESRAMEGFFFPGEDNSIAVSDGDALKLYDIETGELKRELAMEKSPGKPDFSGMWSSDTSSIGKQTAICAAPGTEDFYYANTGGLYRTSGSISERIIDGSS